MNEQNLKRLSSNEARELGKKGGKKSAEVRRKKKRMKETMQLLLNLKVPTEEAKRKANGNRNTGRRCNNAISYITKTSK